MAFVLVALLIFFSFVALIFVSVRLANIRQSAEALEEQGAQELVRKLSSVSEFAFTSSTDCLNCIDFDKLLILNDRKSYQGFWDLDYLRIERTHPKFKGECTKATYPDCNSLTIIESENFGAASEAFISLCRWESSNKGYFKCELGKIIASGKI